MSLINDALKRASQTKLTQLPAAESDTPLRSVDYRQPNRFARVFLPITLVVLALAAWFFMKSWQAGRVINPSPTVVPVLARELPPEQARSGPAQLPPTSAKTEENTVEKPAPTTRSTGVPAPDNLPNVADNSQQAVRKPTLNSIAPIVESSSTNVQAPVEPPKPAFPPVRLQGIFYRPRRPSVMINSKTVAVGDKLGSVKVLAITRDSVTLQWNGETKVLTLEE